MRQHFPLKGHAIAEAYFKLFHIFQVIVTLYTCKSAAGTRLNPFYFLTLLILFYRISDHFYCTLHPFVYKQAKFLIPALFWYIFQGYKLLNIFLGILS